MASFVIINSIDPQLLVVQLEAVRGAEEPEPLAVKEFQDGLILKTNHPKFTYIPISKAGLREEDTKNPAHPLLREMRIDLSGTGEPKYYIEEVEFRNPPDLATCQRNSSTGQLDLTTCQPLTYYGLACFSETNFRGYVKVCSSAAGDQTCSLLFDSNTYCRSILTFRQPVRSRYHITDRLIFFGQKSPPSKLSNGQIANRECFKIGESVTPENCKITCSSLLSGSGGIYRVRQQGDTWGCELIRGIRGVIGLTNLELAEEDESGSFLRYKYPLSMEAITDSAKKYIILLFDNISDFPEGGQDALAPIRMRSYFLVDEKIQNFLDSSDQRLFWLKDKSITDELSEWNEPKSALILPVETIH